MRSVDRQSVIGKSNRATVNRTSSDSQAEGVGLEGETPCAYTYARMQMYFTLGLVDGRRSDLVYK